MQDKEPLGAPKITGQFTHLSEVEKTRKKTPINITHHPPTPLRSHIQIQRQPELGKMMQGPIRAGLYRASHNGEPTEVQVVAVGRWINANKTKELVQRVVAVRPRALVWNTASETYEPGRGGWGKSEIILGVQVSPRTLPPASSHLSQHYTPTEPA